MFTLRGLIFIIIALFSGAFTQAADRFAGVVAKKTDNTLFFQSHRAQSPMAMCAANAATQKQLEKLNTGDFISFYGQQQQQSPDERECFLVNWIEFVGLKSLIGLWANPSQDQLFEFRNFSNLDHYLVSQPSDKTLQASKKSFYYSIAPAKGDPWKLFLSDSDSVIIGSILINSEDSAALLLYSEHEPQDFRLFDLQKVRTTSLKRAPGVATASDQ